MRWSQALNVALLGVALTLMAVVMTSGARPDRRPPTVSHGLTFEVPTVALPDGTMAVVDASGRVVPIRRYERVLAASTTSASIVSQLLEPERVVGYTDYARTRALDSWRYAGRPGIDRMQDIEGILAMRPDLVLMNTVGDSPPIERLRELGVEVFDLGPMRGVETWVDQILRATTVLDVPERGHRYAGQFLRRMATAACHPPSADARIMYLSVYGDRFYGGTAGTSYADVMRYAGVHDVAAARFREWPEYATEHVLSLDPPWILTASGMADRICGHSALGSLQACTHDPPRIVEIHGGLLSDPGEGMLEATELLHDAIYGPCALRNRPGDTNADP